MLYLHKYQFPPYSYVIQLTYVSKVRLIWTLQWWGKRVIEESISVISFVLCLLPHPVICYLLEFLFKGSDNFAYKTCRFLQVANYSCQALIC